MTEKEFTQLCRTTPTGATLTFQYLDTEVRGNFIGCGEEAVIIEVNGRQVIWPREVCECRKNLYPIPTYS
jgi:hypothetical protein